MDNLTRKEYATAPSAPVPDFKAQIAALRAAGAHRFDPVGLHYLDVLARRSAMQQSPVKHLLDAKLAQALASLERRFEQARSAARQMLERTVPHHAHAADALQQLFAAGDFKELERLAKALKPGAEPASLASLVGQLGHPSPDSTGTRSMDNPGMRSELKTIREFRNTWSKLSAGNQVKRALEHAPKNAGPINSHILMLRSLTLMRDVAPDYLHRFMSYADTLLCLDQCDHEKSGNPRKTAGAKQLKKKR